MSAAPRPASLLEAYDLALVELGSNDPSLVVFDAERRAGTAAAPFAKRFPERFVPVDGKEPTILPLAAAKASESTVVFAAGPANLVVGRSYDFLRSSISARRTNVKVVATDGGLAGGGDSSPFPLTEDIGLVRGLPGMTVVVPADAATTTAVTRSVAGFAGPAYVRLASGDLPTVTDGSFQLGRAGVLREGADLTVVAVGALVARALEVAEELGRVGVSVRVLDFASVKPFDEKALLRAARETGAILTMEEHSVLTGLGSLVASTTSEEAPVPIRRVGVPDVFVEPGDPRTLLDRYGMSKERCLEEAWTLLRARGKVQ